MISNKVALIFLALVAIKPSSKLRWFTPTHYSWIALWSKLNINNIHLAAIYVGSWN